ncbi:hypothetical protein INR49_005967 [Caranx melampygus]|nr:hypothetical protein INR49_005967 [Caranx melampygus]
MVSTTLRSFQHVCRNHRELCSGLSVLSPPQAVRPEVKAWLTTARFGLQMIPVPYSWSQSNLDSESKSPIMPL